MAMAKVQDLRSREARSRRHHPHLGFERVEERLLLATFVVTQAGDNGKNVDPTPGSLRQAILQANADSSGGPSLITFDIGAGGLQTIKPPTALPTITRPIVLDATTQPGFAGSPIVELDGSGSDQVANGLVIGASNSQVRGLVINRFPGVGILLDAGAVATGDVIQGNYIGTDSSGSAANVPRMPLIGNAQGGILVNNAGAATIGGAAPGQGNLIDNNGTSGISVVGGSGLSILGNVIGLGNPIGGDPGLRPLLSNTTGISFIFVSNSTIGGTTPGSGNLISGNGTDGVIIGQSSGNLIAGNLVGGSASSKDPQANLGNGIVVLTSTNNTIGGTTASARNVISTNRLNGISLSFKSTGNLVEGNYVGPDVSGLTTPSVFGISLPGNGENGILIDFSSNNTIGGTIAGASNVISGNLGNGVTITNDASALGLPGDANVVQGNIIGLDAQGKKGLGNLSGGVAIVSSPRNLIGGAQSGAGNVISANLGSGVVILGSVSSSNSIQGNRIGTDVLGIASIGNFLNGVSIQNAPANSIGGAWPGQRNVISGNLGAGIQVIGAGSVRTTILGNLVGLDVGGSASLGNLQDGVNVNSTSDVTVGGGALAEANVVSGNGGNGISITGTNSSRNRILGNLIGTNSSGSASIGNAFDGISIAGATGTLISGSAESPGIIAGNGRNGVEVTGGATGTVIQANLIGTNGLSADLGNTLDGVKFDQSPFNQVGGVSLGRGNTLAFNKQDGIEVNGVSAFGVAVQGNLILSNQGDGVRIKDSSAVTVGKQADNTDPGVARQARNVISGNSGAGIEIFGLSTFTTIEGNLIGTDISGTAALGNEIGVFLNDATGNTIGGTTPESRNVISGNRSQGIQVFRVSPSGGGDVIEGNWIGIDVTGVNALGNGATGVGVFLNNAPNNTIGGSTPSASNVISGNGQTGVTVLGPASAGNRIEGNVIGVSPGGDPLRTTAPAQFVGVFLQDAAGNTVGGVDTSSGNLIRRNTVGVEILGVTSSNAVVTNDIDGNTFGVFLNGAARSLIARNSITNNSDIGVSILGNLSTGNVVQGDAIEKNTFAGVYIEGASGNTIGTLSVKSGSNSGRGLPNSISRNGSVGVYLFSGATGNSFRRNTIQGNGLYGAFLFNSAGNVSGLPRSGPDANKIGGSRIASFREFTGPVTAPQTILPPSQNPVVKATAKGGRRGGRS